MTRAHGVAVVAAPLIFRLYSINVGDGVDPELFRAVGTTLARIFLVQIFFYGLDWRSAPRSCNSRRRFFAAAWSPILPNVVIIATLLSLPDAGSADWTLDDVLNDDRLRWTLGLGATLGIASMAIVLVPAMLRRRPPVPAGRRLPPPGGAPAASAVGVDARLRRRQPGGADRRAQPRRPGSRRRRPPTRRLHVLRAPHGLLAVSIATTFEPELARAVARKDKAAFVDQASLGVRLIALFTLPAGVGMLRAAPADHRRAAQHGEFDAVDAANTVAGAGRVRPRPGRLLRLPVHAPRLLRPPGHPHAVRDQRRREPAQHRARGPARRALRRARARPRLRPRLPAVAVVGAPGAVVQGARLPRAPAIAAVDRGECCSPRVARWPKWCGSWPRQVGGNTGVDAAVRLVVRHASSASRSYVGVLVAAAVARSSTSPSDAGVPVGRSPRTAATRHRLMFKLAKQVVEVPDRQAHRLFNERPTPRCSSSRPSPRRRTSTGG